MARGALCFVMLLVAASVCLCKAADPLYPLCGKTSNYTANSTFQRNLNTLFLSLSSNASINGFTTATAGHAPDQVYGLVQCRGDASSADCANCTSDATTQIVQRCPNDKSSMIWFDNCFLRYSDQRFFGTEDFGVKLFMWNPYNASNPTLFNSQLGNLMRNLNTTATTDSSSRLFSAGETNFNDFQKIYGLVQCTRDLSNDSCSNCLTVTISRIPTCCDGKQGARILSPSCIIRYETFPFFNTKTVNQSSQSPTGVGSLPAAQPSDNISPPPSNASTTGTETKSKSSRTIVIVVSSLVPSALIFLCILAAFLCIKKSKKRKLVVAQSHRDQDEDIGSKESFIFDLSRIKAATNDFSEENKLGEGGYGPVYKGELPDGQEIAVKRLSSGSGQGAIEFKNEVKLVAKLQHRNLVRLLGCCLEGNEKILVYEYVPNRSLNYFLFDQTKRMQLDWLTRLKIINGIAKGLLYLHEDSRLKIIHRDLKASNILLDKDMNPKISDFGMAKLVGLDETQGNTSRIAGTYGYMSPEYAMHGQFSVKSDVFSFGVLMLEIVSGQKVSSFSSQSQSGQELLSYTWRLWTENRAIGLLDETLIESCQVREVVRCIHVGLLCVQEDPVLRPTMSAVVLMLSSNSFTLAAPSTPAFFLGRSRMEAGSSSTGSSAETTKLEASKGGCVAQSISSAEFSTIEAR